MSRICAKGVGASSTRRQRPRESPHRPSGAGWEADGARTFVRNRKASDPGGAMSFRRQPALRHGRFTQADRTLGSFAGTVGAYPPQRVSPGSPSTDPQPATGEGLPDPPDPPDWLPKLAPLDRSPPPLQAWYQEAPPPRRERPRLTQAGRGERKSPQPHVRNGRLGGTSLGLAWRGCEKYPRPAGHHSFRHFGGAQRRPGTRRRARARICSPKLPQPVFATGSCWRRPPRSGSTAQSRLRPE